VLYDTWSLTVREEHRVRLFKNRVLRYTLGPKSDEVTGKWNGECIVRSFMIYTSCQMLLG